MVVEQSNDAGIRNLFFLLDGEQIVNSPTCVAEIVLSESSPKHVDWVTGFFVRLVAKAFQTVPVSLTDEVYDHGFSHFSLLQSDFGHRF